MIGASVTGSEKCIGKRLAVYYNIPIPGNDGRKMMHKTKETLGAGGGNILFVTYFFPPCGGSGVLRVVRFVKYLRRFGWTPFVLTVDERDIEKLVYGAITVDRSYMDIAASTHVLRTRLVRPSYIVFSLLKGLVSIPSAVRRLFGGNSSGRSRRVETGRAPAGGKGGAPADASREENRRKTDAKGYYSQDVGPVRKLLFELILIVDQIFEWLPFTVISGIRFVRKCKIDVICSSSPPWGVHIAAFALKRLCGTKWVMDLRDPFYAIEMESVKTKESPRIVRMFYRFMERIFMRNADVVICNCDEIKEYYRSKYRSSRFEVVTNGFDPDDFPAPKTESGAGVRTEICYIGELYPKIRTPDAFLEALAFLLKREPAIAGAVSVRILGASAYLESKAFRGLIKKLGIEALVRCRPYVPHREAIDAMIGADVLLLLQPHRSTNYQVPAKLYEYIATGNPMIAIAPKGSATFNLIRRYKLGLVSDTADRTSIERSIRAAVEGTLPAPTMESIAYFSSEAVAGRFAGIIDGLLEKQRYNTSG